MIRLLTTLLFFLFLIPGAFDSSRYAPAATVTPTATPTAQPAAPTEPSAAYPPPPTTEPKTSGYPAAPATVTPTTTPSDICWTCPTPTPPIPGD